MGQVTPDDDSIIHHELSPDYPDPVIRALHRAIRVSVRVLALSMALVIVLGVVDVGHRLMAA